MPLSDKDKSEARDAIALALELNEPETMIEGLRRLCARKADETGSWGHTRGFTLTSLNEHNRWRNAAKALDSVCKELESANAPQTRQESAPGAQETPNTA